MSFDYNAVLHHFFQAPQHRNAGQLQRACDLTCANGRAHDRAQEHIDADGPIGQAVTLACKFDTGTAVGPQRLTQNLIRPSVGVQRFACDRDIR